MTGLSCCSSYLMYDHQPPPWSIVPPEVSFCYSDVANSTAFGGVPSGRCSAGFLLIPRAVADPTTLSPFPGAPEKGEDRFTGVQTVSQARPPAPPHPQPKAPKRNGWPGGRIAWFAAEFRLS